MRVRILIASMVGALAYVALPAQTWTTFTSQDATFSVQYPASWHLLKNAGGLDAISFPPEQRVRGVVLIPSGAELTVTKQPSQVHTLEQWVRQDLLGSKPEAQREFGPGDRPDGCERLVEVRWKWEPGPEQPFQETAYYCAAKVGLLRVRLTYWVENSSASALDTIARKVALSLRVL